MSHGRTGALLLVLGVSLSAVPSYATTLQSANFVCPVGGETFRATVYGSWFGYGGRPDGRALGTMRGYVPPPECPGNRLIMYRTFSAAELERLPAILSSEEYKRLVAEETEFYRVAWLEHTLDPQSSEYVWHLLRATWHVDSDPAKKARYRERFLAVAEPLPAAATDLRSMFLQLRVLNVYREMGQFDRALKGLKALPVADVGRGLPWEEDEAMRLSEADQARWSFVREVRRIEGLILRKDAAINPIDILPDWMAEEECYFRQPKTAFETEFCSTPTIKKRLEEEKEFFESERQYYAYDGPIMAPPPPPQGAAE
jgi:hypothetical protein